MRHVTGLAVLMAVLAMGPAARAESAGVLLQKGIYLEETKGDPVAAMDVYKKIIADAQAERPLIAQAHYHLARCYQKNNETINATKTYEKLIAEFPDQKELVAQAQKQIPRPKEAQVVRKAVMTISTCTETDPRVKESLDSLKGLDEAKVVKELTIYLDSDTPTIRRSAIYILWRGQFKNIDPAIEKLSKFCSHPEVFTRGMAALTLGGNKIQSSFPLLRDMALKDTSGYARRCAAYALGSLGLAQAKPVLEKVLEDKDPLVKNNAQAALKMLTLSDQDAPTTKPQGAPQVVKTLPEALFDNVSPSLDKITVTFDQPMMDRSWSWTGGGETYPQIRGQIYYNDAKTTCILPVKLEPGKVYWVGINSPSFQNFKSANGEPAKRYVILFATKGTDGKPTPIPNDMLSEAKAINAITENAIKNRDSCLVQDDLETGTTSPTGWEQGADIAGVKYIWDKQVGYHGKASLCLQKTANRFFPIAQWYRTVPYTGNARALKLSAQVKAKNARKAILDALFLNEKGEWIEHHWAAYIGEKNPGDPPANHDWKEYSGVVNIPEGTRKIQIGLQMYGPGTVWFDNVKACYTTESATQP